MLRTQLILRATLSHIVKGFMGLHCRLVTQATSRKLSQTIRELLFSAFGSCGICAGLRSFTD
eukprot:6460171-Amphidinium_carterae.1